MEKSLKRLLSLAIVLFMVISMIPVDGLQVYAAETAPVSEEHPITADNAASYHCEHCGVPVQWTAWTRTGGNWSLSGSTHYYMTGDMSGQIRANTLDSVCFHMNGYTIDGNSTDTIYRILNGAKLRIDDCTAYTDAEGVYHVGKFINGKTTGGVGVEKTFPIHSPNIEKIEVTRKGKVRRSKLYYLRDRAGKAAKTKEQI